MPRISRWIFVLALFAQNCGGHGGDEVDSGSARDGTSSDADSGSARDGTSSDADSGSARDGTSSDADSGSARDSTSSDADARTVGDDVARDAGTVLDAFLDAVTIRDVTDDVRDAEAGRDAAPEEAGPPEDAHADAPDGLIDAADAIDARSLIDVIDAGSDANERDDVATDIVDGSADSGLPPSDSVAVSDGALDAAEDGDADCARCGLLSLMVVPQNPTIVPSTPYPMHAIGSYQDNSTRDLTTNARWTSSNPSTATVSDAVGTKGQMTGVGGTTIITAEVGDIAGVTIATVIWDGPVALTISPTTPSVSQGMTLPLKATLTYTDGSTTDATTLVAWSSSATSIASIAVNGVVTGLAPGMTTITATFDALSDSVPLTVTSRAGPIR